MKFPVYLMYYLVILPLSKLPFGVLYTLSDGLYFVIYYLVGYRKAVVADNLKKAFPEKSDSERRTIEKLFFHDLCDLIVENIKFFSISEDEIRRRCIFSNPELADKLYDKHPSLLGMTAHYGNWEIAGMSTGLNVRFWPVGSYQPLSNKGFDELIAKMRSRYFTVMPFAKAKKMVDEAMRTGYFVPNKPDPTRKPTFIFLADQAPSPKRSKYWTTFLNQETAFYTQVEEIAREYNLPVMFCNMVRTSRGNFRIDLTLLTEYAAQTQPFEITTKYVELLEKCIRQTPHNWLWSHKRWKRKRSDS